MIPTYQCAGYLAETLASVLAQAQLPALMQIEVVDDGSDDEPGRVVRRLGHDRVLFYAQPRNVGIAANLSTCVERSRGAFVHVLHGDDVVLPGFYEAYGAFFDAKPQAVMAFSRAIAIDERGRRRGFRGCDLGRTRLLEGALETMIADNPIVASSAVVRREAYERLGGFSTKLSHAADWEMWMRVASLGPVGYLHEPRVLYREHAASDSNRAILEGRNIDDYVRAVERGIELLSPMQRGALRRSTHRKYASVARDYRWELHARGQHRAALRQAIRELRLNPIGRSPVRVLSSALRVLRHSVR
jgi:glycosyltransferase involved in cell wall biosynthesis